MNDQQTEAPVSNGWMRVVVGRRPKRTLARVVVLVVVTFVTFKFLFLPIRVEGHSMEPTYRNGRINLINRLAYKRSRPQRGDIVAIQLAGTRVMLLKRVVGLPGERVTIRRGQVSINGKPLDEPYLTERGSWGRDDFVVKDHEYFVIGDNRRISDSGSVAIQRIVGRIVF